MKKINLFLYSIFLLSGIVCNAQNIGQSKDFIETALGLNIKMIYVEGGTFVMGGETPDSAQIALPAHFVTLDSFYIAEFETTQAQWEKVMGTDIVDQYEKHRVSSKSTYVYGSNYPIHWVSWEEANLFCKQLSYITGRNYSLPTEAQWEYAASDGHKMSEKTPYSGGFSIDNVAWYGGNSDWKLHQVGQKLPNKLGIYDMTGNVSEMCRNYYYPYSYESQVNPTGPSSGKARMLRGGDVSHGSTTSSIVRRLEIYGEAGGWRGFRIICIP